MRRFLSAMAVTGAVALGAAAGTADASPPSQPVSPQCSLIAVPALMIAYQIDPSGQSSAPLVTALRNLQYQLCP
ncbi:hypothetical protein F3087_29150 [Nocardia colli]|uniref:DUF732 domain-containing protein n=1 Tax=Nocardia colli TaxID=2545717 RepID=A0A5N0E8F7_9NOCA|nr:hypothetical protein [Nocardia colli]KAA8885698.1 hypothetical protein F3087_29150 [Nocardia colli]